MPSANKTPLGLNQWQANEYPKMADFNEDNRIIDEKITELQSGSGVKIYTTTELSDPQEGKIYNVKIEEATSTINEKPVYKENTTQSVTLKAGKVATVYYQGGSFFYKASASGNAVAEHVLADKKFSNDDDTDITGTMENHGAKIFTPTTANIIIPKGYYDGTGYIEGDSDLVASNIVQGKQIFGVNGNALKYEQSEKTSIANALTSKGVPTSTTASWSTIEKNIRNLNFRDKFINGSNLSFKLHSHNLSYNSYYEEYSGDVIYKFITNFPVGTILQHFFHDGTEIFYAPDRKEIQGLGITIDINGSPTSEGIAPLVKSYDRFYYIPHKDSTNDMRSRFFMVTKPTQTIYVYGFLKSTNDTAPQNRFINGGFLRVFGLF